MSNTEIHPPFETGSEPHDRRRGIAVAVIGGVWGIIVATWLTQEWFDGLLAAVSLWCAAGLWIQARDLQAELRGAAGLSDQERWGYRYQFCVRWAAVAAIVVHWLVQLLRRCTDYFDPSYEDVIATDSLGGHLLMLALFCSAGWARAATRDRVPARHAPRLVTILAVAASLGVGIVICVNDLLLHYLVYLACEAIECVQPLGVSFGSIPIEHGRPVVRFFASSAAAVVLGLAIVALLVRLARRDDQQQPTVRCVIGFTWLVLGLCVAVGYALWASTTGIEQIAPSFAAVETSAFRMIQVAILVGVLTTAATYRIVRREPAADRTLRFRRRWRIPDYYHANKLVLMFLVTAVVADLTASGYWPDNPFTRLRFLEGFADNPTLLFHAAIGLQGLVALMSPPLRMQGPVGRPPAGFDGWKFAVVWLVLFFTLLALIDAFGWFCFSVWLTPWHELPIP